MLLTKNEPLIFSQSRELILLFIWVHLAIERVCILIANTQVNMISKYDNHTLQTNPRHCKEEPQKTKSQDIRSTIKVKQSVLSLPHQDEKLEGRKVLNNKTRTKHITHTHNESNNKQRINNNNRTTALERTPPKTPVGGGWKALNAFYWYQTFALDYVVVKTQKLLSLYAGFLTTCLAMFHHRETIYSNQIDTL